MSRSLSVVLAAALLAGGMPSGAMASLLGQEVTCSADFHLCNPASAEVATGPEFTIIPTTPVWEIDIGDSDITMRLTLQDDIVITPSRAVVLGGLFWGSDPSATLLGIANLITSGVVIATPNVVVVAANAVTINYGGSNWLVGSFISFDLVTTHGSEVPEPSAFWLFAFGLALIFWWTRRTRSLAGGHRDRDHTLIGRDRPSPSTAIA